MCIGGQLSLLYLTSEDEEQETDHYTALQTCEAPSRFRRELAGAHLVYLMPSPEDLKAVGESWETPPPTFS